MKTAVMQPYLFPYIGYFHLLNAVDNFVIYDDVNYIKKGWINRNNILVNGQPRLFTLELKKASQNKLINEIEIGNNNLILLETIRHSYRRAPYFKSSFQVIENILNSPVKNLGEFVFYSLKVICQHLGIKVNWFISSDLKKNVTSSSAQEKILEICSELGTSHYINLPGGRSLYDKKYFDEMNVELLFIEPLPINYKQFNNDFVPNLSIIDIMMFNSVDDIKDILTKYRLLK